MFRFLAPCILLVYSNLVSGYIPTRCSRYDDLDCVRSSGQALVPILAGASILPWKQEPLDPMLIDTIEDDVLNLKLKLKNNTLKGLKECILEEIDVNPAESKQFSRLRCSGELSGQYEGSGELLTFPIQQEGNYVMKIYDMVFNVTSEVKTFDGEDGLQYANISTFDYTYNVEKGINFYADNLFNGNIFLSAPIIALANFNWRYISTLCGAPVAKAIMHRIQDAVQNLLTHVPMDDLATENFNML